MGFPATLTHEEQALLNKFALLKKKKKAPVQKNHTVNNNDSVISPVSPVKKEFSTEKSPQKEPTINPKDAKEKAKQLLASGQLKISKEHDNRSFKRAKVSTVERRQSNTSSLAKEELSNRDQAKKIENIKKDSYSNFVVGGRKHTDVDKEHKVNPDFNEKQQNSLFIRGHNLTKNIMDAYFPHYGPIKSIYFDQDKGHGYITYQRHESAKNAIDELHGQKKDGVTLNVSFVRKRPYDDNQFGHRPYGPKHADDVDSSRDHDNNRQKEATASNQPSKASAVKEKRKLITYEADSFEF